MKMVFSGILIWLALILVQPALGANIRIELKPFVKVTSENIYLGDVAALFSGDFATVQRFSSLHLGRAPVFGRKVELSREQLDRWIRSRLMAEPRELIWGGAQSVEVEMSGQEVSQSLLLKVAKDELASWLGKKCARFEIAEPNMSGSILVRPGKVSLVPRILPDNFPVSRRMQIWVDISIDGVLQRAIPVNFSVEAFQNVYVVSADMPARHDLAGADIELKEVDATLVSDKKILRQKPAAPTRLRKSLKAGEIVAESMMEPLPDVLQGQEIVLRIKTGGIAVESPVTVLQDGVVGQKIRVKKKGSQGSILAKVIGRSLVSIVD